MKRFFELAIATLILMWGIEASAQNQQGVGNRLAVGAENITIEEQSWQDGDSSIPMVVLSIDIENSGAALKICHGRVRISYKGRNVAILSLEKKVKISSRQNQKIKLPLRVSFLQNSTTLAFKEALKRGDVSDMKIDWLLDVKGGLKHYKIEQEPLLLTDVIAAEQIEQLKEVWLAE